jgi:hypothetical protein
LLAVRAVNPEIQAAMDPLSPVAFGALLALPFHLVVRRYIAVHTDPALLRERGVIIVHDRALEERSAPIGEYMGRPIWGSVTFKGMVYRFDRIVQPRERDLTGPGELYLDPGFIYRTD